MDLVQMNHYKRVLEAERKRIISLTDRMEAHGLDESFKEASGELSSYDNHPADQGDIMLERGKDIALRDNNSTLLSMIDDALAGIQNGTYGTCDRCGREIGAERLEAFPYTTMCVDCKQDVERFDAPRERPIEEEFLATPFDRTFTDGTENVVYDGEDAWQDVARYGTSNGPAYTPGSVSPEDSFYDADEEQGIVDWGDAVLDDGFTEEFQDDEHTGQVTRDKRREYQRKD